MIDGSGFLPRGHQPGDSIHVMQCNFDAVFPVYSGGVTGFGPLVAQGRSENIAGLLLQLD